MDAVNEFIVGLLIIAALVVFAVGIYRAATTNTPPIHCPHGWKPNTGYLQQGCVPK